MQTLKRIDTVSLGKLIAITQACLSLLYLPFLLIAGHDGAAAIGGGVSLMASAIKASGIPDSAAIVVWLVFLPFYYGVTGFTSSVIFASLYNVASGWFGGIKIELDPTEPRAMSASGD